MESKKLKLTKQILISLSDDKLSQIQGGTGSDHFCTGGCTGGGFTCLANTCGCESVNVCDSDECGGGGCTSYIIC